MPMYGQCSCEAISVTMQDQPPDSAHSTLCHCRNCSNQAGSSGSYVMLVDTKDVEVDGSLKDYLDKKTTSGTPMHRWFCENCGSPIISTTAVTPGKTFVKMGLFANFPSPSTELFTKRRQEWEPPMAGATQVSGAS